MRRMGGCIVVMELPSFCCPQVRSFAPHSITKATKYRLVVLFGVGLALWTVIRRFCMSKVRTCLMTLSFRLVEGLPWRGSLSTDVLPFLKRLYHSFIRVILMASSPKDCWIFRIVSTWISPSFLAKCDAVPLLKSFPSFCNNWQSDERSQHLHNHRPTAGDWRIL